MSLVRFRFWAFFLGVLAQSVEHLTFNQVVRGSNPRCLTLWKWRKLSSYAGFRCFYVFFAVVPCCTIMQRYSGHFHALQGVSRPVRALFTPRVILFTLLNEFHNCIKKSTIVRSSRHHSRHLRHLPFPAAHDCRPRSPSFQCLPAAQQFS